jgi:hypothetical protein
MPFIKRLHLFSIFLFTFFFVINGFYSLPSVFSSVFLLLFFGIAIEDDDDGVFGVGWDVVDGIVCLVLL